MNHYWRKRCIDKYACQYYDSGSHGCAKAYVTGEEKWLHIVEQYWKCAVIDRGCFATGGQTQGEIWTPMKKLKARLGDKNQNIVPFIT